MDLRPGVTADQQAISYSSTPAVTQFSKVPHNDSCRARQEFASDEFDAVTIPVIPRGFSGSMPIL